MISLVNNLNSKLAGINSNYRLKYHSDSQIELVDIEGGSTHGEDDQFLDLTDLEGYVNDIIQAEMSCR